MTIKRVAIIIGIAMVAGLVLAAAVEIAYAVKYPIKVNVSKDKGKYGVSPLTDSLDFGDLPQGSRSARYVTLENSSGSAVYIVVHARGEISNFVRIKPNGFVLKGGEKVKLTFELNVPASANEGNYEGRVYIFKLPKLL